MRRLPLTASKEAVSADAPRCMSVGIIRASRSFPVLASAHTNSQPPETSRRTLGVLLAFHSSQLRRRAEAWNKPVRASQPAFEYFRAIASPLERDFGQVPRRASRPFLASSAESVGS